ncbi:MAG: 5-formyltetrahydrofolate cyclo-ligase [Ahrensia sp.]|nr:5-formyltetrahydrofolate cyclo-ligase [Ahrensia sp.]
MSDNTTKQAKSDLRKAVLARRDALTAEFRIQASLDAADHGLTAPCFSDEVFVGDTVVSGFLPIRSEIDARPLLAGLAQLGARLCLPVVIDKTTIVFRELLRTAPLVETGFGTVGPPPDARILDPKVLIMPLSAFDRRGGRMGYGAGYYDRAVETLLTKGIKPTLLGMAFCVQEVDAVPMEQHDAYLHGIITERAYLDAHSVSG